MRVLLIENDNNFATSLKNSLEQSGHLTEVMDDGMMALQRILEKNFDMIILNPVLPIKNGFQISAEIRAKKITTPVVMISSLNSIDDKINGFESGADDYLVKPFDTRELLLRLRAIDNRINRASVQNNTLSFADLELNLDKKCAMRAGKEIDLTAKEYSLLEYFLKNKGKVITRATIAEQVWNLSFNTGSNTIDVYVNFLRKKIDKNHSNKLIHTVFGMGYILKEGL